jgi:hypothetical protein
MKQANSRRNTFRIEWLAYTLMASAIVLGIAGFGVKTFCTSNSWTDLVSDFYSNVVTDLLGMGFVILVIDRLYQERNDERERKMLISQLASPFNVLARDAARILRDKGWHKDLGEISLYRANLEGAELYDFVLPGANMTYADLKDANLNGTTLDDAIFSSATLEGVRLHRTGLRNATITSAESDKLLFKDAKFFETDLTGAKFLGTFAGIMTESPHPHLQVAYSLRGSIMPNGERYDGRYNLSGDLAVASYNRDTNDPLAMSDFYGVSTEVYNQGQTWHVEYAKYIKTREKKARALCAKNGGNWDKLNPDCRGKFVDKFLPEPYTQKTKRPSQKPSSSSSSSPAMVRLIKQHRKIHHPGSKK